MLALVERLNATDAIMDMTNCEEEDGVAEAQFT
jgi:hypothetical protein